MRHTVRQGMGKGRGSGYKNLIKSHDHRVHHDSGLGRKQPQRVNILSAPSKLNIPSSPEWRKKHTLRLIQVFPDETAPEEYEWHAVLFNKSVGEGRTKQEAEWSPSTLGALSKTQAIKYKDEVYHIKPSEKKFLIKKG